LVNVADLTGGLGVVGEVDEVDADLARERMGVVGAALSLSEETREGGWALFPGGAVLDDEAVGAEVEDDEVDAGADATRRWLLFPALAVRCTSSSYDLGASAGEYGPAASTLVARRGSTGSGLSRSRPSPSASELALSRSHDPSLDPAREPSRELEDALESHSRSSPGGRSSPRAHFAIGTPLSPPLGSRSLSLSALSRSSRSRLPVDPSATHTASDRLFSLSLGESGGDEASRSLAAPVNAAGRSAPAFGLPLLSRFALTFTLPSLLNRFALAVTPAPPSVPSFAAAPEGRVTLTSLALAAGLAWGVARGVSRGVLLRDPEEAEGRGKSSASSSSA
jgi:hypothetical protein